MIVLDNHGRQSTALATAGINADNTLLWQWQPFPGRQQFLCFSVALEPCREVKSDMPHHSQRTVYQRFRDQRQAERHNAVHRRTSRLNAEVQVPPPNAG